MTKNRERKCIFISSDLHRKLKICSSAQGKKMQDYLNDIVAKEVTEYLNTWKNQAQQETN